MLEAFSREFLGFAGVREPPGKLDAFSQLSGAPKTGGWRSYLTETSKKRIQAETL